MNDSLDNLCATNAAASTILPAHRSTESAPSLMGRFSLWDLLPEFLALGSYLLFLAAILLHHEPWADEAQAWQLARELPLGQLFQNHLRYEGSPGLWYLVLSILIRLHVGYVGLHWVCGVIASIGASLLIFQAPFPRLIRLLLPFTYFFAFQYAIVARSYVLFPPLLLALATIWRKGATRPWVMALLLGLIANISLHCAAISGGFAIAYAVELFRNRNSVDGKRHLGIRLVGPAFLLLIFYGLVLWTAWPPHDLRVAGPIADTITGDSVAATSSAVAGQPVIRKTALRTSVRDMIFGALAASLFGITTPLLLGLPFWALMIWHFGRRNQLYLMTPLALFVLFSGISAFAFWHSGLLAVSLVAAFWISLVGLRPGGSGHPVFERSVMLALIYAVATQIAWTADVAHFDYKGSYSPDLEASRYLRSFIEGHAKVAVTYTRETGISAYDAVGLLPYFNHNFYMNMAQPFWVWSRDDRTEAEFWQDLQTRPELVLVEYHERTPYDASLDAKNPRMKILAAAGYTHTRTFCGAKLAQFTVMEYTCHLVFERRRNGNSQ